MAYGPEHPLFHAAAFLKDRMVASLYPSSEYVARRVVAAAAPRRPRCVVEYGPAEGAISRRILDRLPEDGVLLAVERNGRFAEALGGIRDPRLRIVHGDALDIAVIMRAQGLREADAVISGIPFSCLDDRCRDRLLAETAGQLGSQGRFVAYQCTTFLVPALRALFRRVRTEFEPRNLPPLFIITACGRR